MPRVFLTICAAATLLCGCSDTTSTSKDTKPSPTPKPAISIAKYDDEAAALGFPDKFISKEKDNIDWSQANEDQVEGMDVEVYDTGITVEVCGGLCDQ